MEPSNDNATDIVGVDTTVAIAHNIESGFTTSSATTTTTTTTAASTMLTTLSTTMDMVKTTKTSKATQTMTTTSAVVFEEDTLVDLVDDYTTSTIGDDIDELDEGEVVFSFSLPFN